MKRKIVPLSLLLVLFSILPVAPGAQSRPRTLLALLAHADDETAASPVLARYAREGVRIHMIVATDGSGGSGAQATLQRSENGPVGDALVKARAEEAKCSATAIGAQPPVLLTFPDGKLGDYLSDRTLLARLTDQIGAEIARLRPDVVITWGPDGGTGHPDHRLVSNIATQLMRTGAPGMPERLFYMSFPENMYTLTPGRTAAPLFYPQPQYFTMKVPFTQADLSAAQTAMACHKTQFNPEQLPVIQSGLARLWNGVIAFIPAVSSWSGNDLFAQTPQDADRLAARTAARARVDALIESFKKVAPANATVAAELRALRDDDQRFRVEGMRLWNEKGMDSPEARAVWEKQGVLDAMNQARLDEIVARHGWPGVKLVGLQGADAAFLIVDHAPLAFQKKYLPALQQATDARDALPMWAAMLDDRVRVNEGRAQRYGTQVHKEAGWKEWRLQPIEDELHVDDRRAQVGFEPLAEYLKQFGIVYKPPR